MTMADFSQPGSDGALPPGVNEWRRGLVYTAKPEIPCPLRCGQEYRISVGFKQKVRLGGEFARFGGLYQRVTAIASHQYKPGRCTYPFPKLGLQHCSVRVCKARKTVLQAWRTHSCVPRRDSSRRSGRAH